MDVGERPNADASVAADEDDAFAGVQQDIYELKKVIRGAPGPSAKYARIAFLYYAEKGYETYNPFEDRTFDELIEANMVTHQLDAEGCYELNPAHPRNKRLLAVLARLENSLDEYLASHGPDPDDIFEWSLKDAGFWNAYIGWTVV